MFDNTSNINCLTFKVQQHHKYEQSKDRLDLLDISPKEKIWNKHRANVDVVADYYAGGEQGYSDRNAQRVSNCSKWLKFQFIPSSEGVIQLKLSDARFCRVRYCPVCQWRRSMLWKAKAYKILPKVIADYPKYRWLFITLTVKNCQIQELRKTLDEINKAFKRLTELKAWSAKGWIKSVEVTKGRDGVTAHPHLHILAMVMPSYFSHGYLSQSKWVEWQQCLRVDYKPIIHVSAIAKHHDPKIIVPEILKYQVKESDLVADREWFLELTRQMHQTRGIAVGGVLRSYLRLEEEPADLISKDEEIDEVDEWSLTFRWKRDIQKYK